MTAKDRNELRKIAVQLWTLANGELSDAEAKSELTNKPKADYLVQARAEIVRRRARQKALPGRLLREPAWDILLELFIRELEGKGSTAKLAHFAAGVPCTTALRWLDVLEAEGFIARKADTEDRRFTIVALTAVGERSVMAALDHMAGAENSYRVIGNTRSTIG